MKYNHGPLDDAIYRLQSTTTIAGSAEDADYPPENWFSMNPALPAKLTTTTGYWDFDFGSAVPMDGFALVYCNAAAGATVALTGGAAPGATTVNQSLTIATWGEDGWPTNNPYVLLSGATYRYWRITVSVNSSTTPLALGRPVFSLNVRTMTNDILWTEAFHEDEDWGLIEQATELGVETIYPLGGKRRSLIANIGAGDTQATAIQSLRRAVQGRTYPFLAIPAHVTNDAWFVRFVEGPGRRSYVIPRYSMAPFSLREVSRGLPWP